MDAPTREECNIRHEDLNRRFDDMQIDTNRRIDNIAVDVTKIKDNHLPHIQLGIDAVSKDVQKINLKLAKWAGMFAVGIGVLTIIIDVAIKVWVI